MLEVDKKALGGRIRKRRIKARLSQTALGLLVDMKQQGIVSLEQGTVKRPTRLKELAAALHTTEDWLLYATPPEEAPSPGEFDIAGLHLTRVPLLSWVAAGRFADPSSQLPVEDVPLLAFADLGSGDFFATRVRGDSMDRISPDDSTIIVNRAIKDLAPGKPFLFAHRGETTFKLWEPDPPRLEPFSTNAIHKAIYVSKKRDLEVIGRVRRTVLDL